MKIVYTLVFALAVLFNSIQLSSQGDSNSRKRRFHQLERPPPPGHPPPPVWNYRDGLSRVHFPIMNTYTIVIEMEDGSILGDRLKWNNFDGSGRYTWLTPENYEPRYFENYEVMINMQSPSHVCLNGITLTNLYVKPGFVPSQHLPAISFMHLEGGVTLVAQDFKPWNLAIPRHGDAYETHIFITIPGSTAVFASTFALKSLPQVSVGNLLTPLYHG